jgi:hypothetical protein
VIARSARVSLAPMDEDSSSHRLRWVLLLLLLGTAVWAARSRQGADPAAAPEPWRPPTAPEEPDRRIGGTAQPAVQRLQSADARTGAPGPAAPPQPPTVVDPPTTELSVDDAPGGRTARARRAAVVEVPPTAARALPDGSPPGPEYTVKAKSGSELFHGPQSPYFGRTRAEFWFRTAADARAAGFTEWTPRRRGSSG